MPTLFRLLLALTVLWPALLKAQEYPKHQDLFVNDYGGVLSADTVVRLRADLSKLKDDTGVEMTVLTIPMRGMYGSSASIESFATALFNNWGVGRKEFNDGILVLVAVADREMRLELGSGYDQGYDVLAQDIVDNWFLPEFRNGNYSAGVQAGVDQVINRIAKRHSAGLPAEKPAFSLGKLIAQYSGVLFAAVVAAIIGMAAFGQQLGDWAYRFRQCPTCGQRGLHREHVPPVANSQTGLIVTSCRNCNWRDERHWMVNRGSSRSDGSGGSFGGGSSSGGGASGKW